MIYFISVKTATGSSIRTGHLCQTTEDKIQPVLSVEYFRFKSQTQETVQEFLNTHHSWPIQVAFLGKVAAFSAMWCVCSWSGRQGDIQAGILDTMGLFLSWVTCHMSRNTAFPYSHHIYVNNFHLAISPPIWC